MASRNVVAAQKQAAAVAAVQPGMLIGLGTGTTAALAIAAVARRVSGGLVIRAVATPERTAHAARLAGIVVVEFEGVDTLDLAIDGVDEVDPHFVAIKGGGGAMLREKIVANAARRMIAIADASKLVARLGARPIPLEVLPFASALVLRRARELGCEPSLRRQAKRLVQTDQGNLVIDCAFPTIEDPEQLAYAFASIPGVLGHGLFMQEIDTIYIGTSQGVERRDRPINL